MALNNLGLGFVFTARDLGRTLSATSSGLHETAWLRGGSGLLRGTDLM